MEIIWIGISFIVGIALILTVGVTFCAAGDLIREESQKNPRPERETKELEFAGIPCWESAQIVARLHREDKRRNRRRM